MTMHNEPLIDLAGPAIRARVCTRCCQRPVGSEKLGATTPRSCETECPIFISLPELIRVTRSPTTASPEKVMLETVCQTCTCSASAGDYCADRINRTCPLSRHAGEVLEILEEIQEASASPPPAIGV
jgi:hypothetical protein